MGFFDFAKRKIIVSTFQNDFDKFRTSSSRVQIEVGERIFAEMKYINTLSGSQLNSMQSQLLLKYKTLRNQSLAMGAKDQLDANYAFAALMESVILSMGDNDAFTKISKDIIGWLSMIGVISRNN
jgi:hypothetical protein